MVAWPLATSMANSRRPRRLVSLVTGHHMNCIVASRHLVDNVY